MLINQGIIINVILIFAILWLANYLSEDSILNTIKNIFKINLKNIGNINTKKYNLKNLNDEEASSLETFLKSLIVKSKGGKINYKKIFKPNENDKNNILKFLEKKIRNEEHKITKLVINNIVFYKKDIGFEFKPFILEGKYYINDKFKGTIKLQLELSFKFDNPDSIFISPQRITNHSGNYFIHRITFIDLKNNINSKLLKKITSDSENIKDKKYKMKSKNKKQDSSTESNKSDKSDKSDKSERNLEESNNNSEEPNNSEGNSEESNNNSVNSLIPDEIEFSTEYNTSHNTSINTSINQSA